MLDLRKLGLLPLPSKKRQQDWNYLCILLIKEVWPCLYIHVWHKIGKKILTEKIHLLLLFSNSVVSNSVTPWTVAYQVSLSMEFSRQEHWSGLPCPPRKHTYIDISSESLSQGSTFDLIWDFDFWDIDLIWEINGGKTRSQNSLK